MQRVKRPLVTIAGLLAALIVGACQNLPTAIVLATVPPSEAAMFRANLR